MEPKARSSSGLGDKRYACDKHALGQRRSRYNSAARLIAAPGRAGLQAEGAASMLLASHDAANLCT